MRTLLDILARTRLHAALAGLLLATAGMPVAGAPPRRDVAASRDVQLAVQAKQALLKDPALAKLNLGVSVRQGIATVYGAVPDADLARRAVLCVGQVDGILRVQNSIRVETAEAPAAAPPRRDARLPGAEAPPARDLVAPDAGRVHNSLTPPSSLAILGRTAAPTLSVTPPLLLPTGSGPAPARPSSSPTSASSPLAEAVDLVRRKDERYRAIRPEVYGKVVILRGTYSQGALLYTLAREIAKVPGVECVVVDNQRPDPTQARPASSGR